MSNTFIFFDLETTGLIRNDCMPKITELSLIAVSRNAITNTTKTLPRVLRKLVLPINPVTYISQNVETITGLSNQNLDDVKPFTCETYDMIINFIKQLIPPVCFVAYNGYKFDYPIFLKEIENINKDVSEEILCIDMMHLIINFFSNKDSLSKKSALQANKSTSYDTEYTDISFDDGWNDSLSAALDSTEDACSNSLSETLIDLQKQDETSFNRLSEISTDLHQENETCFNNISFNYYEEIQKAIEKTPEHQTIKSSRINLSNIRNSKTRRRKLAFVNSKPSNFKLTTVYKHICGTDPLNAHNAEGDCLFMIECAIQIKQFFLEWADLNAVSMINYKK